MADKLIDTDDWLDDAYWDTGISKPKRRYGWTWVMTSSFAPECYSLIDDDGELMGCFYNRWNRVICWAPFTWAEEVYRSHMDVGEYGFEDDAERERHFEKVGVALTEWVQRKRDAGVDIVLLRDTHAYYFETGNGHEPLTEEEREFENERHNRLMERLRNGEAEEGEVSFEVDGWSAELVDWWYCEGYRIRDETGQLRGNVQVRLGVVRVLAALKEDADRVDPRIDDARRASASCRGQIVIQERLRPLAQSFAPGERDLWLRRAVGTIRATPNPDRTWPSQTLGAKGSEGQKMFPTSPRHWT